MNNIQLSGRLTRDPELKATLESGKAVTHFGIAVDRDYSKEVKAEMEAKGKQTVDFFDCTVYGPVGEKLLIPYAKKGARVVLDGRLQINKIDNNGVSNKYTNIIVKNIELIDWPERA